MQYVSIVMRKKLNVNMKICNFKNKKIDYVLFMNKVRLWLWFINTIIMIINIIFFNYNDFVIIFNIAIYLMILIETTIISLLIDHNRKIIERLLSANDLKYYERDLDKYELKYK